jgi:dethiobiotin synthetase
VTRPAQLVVVTGTGTEVGKTWVGARALHHLRANGVRVAARKPVQSFEAGVGPTDAELLAGATGEEPDEVCPRHRWYEAPMAPPMAAEALGQPPFRIADLLGELRWPDAVDVGLVEGAGGPRSPLAGDGDTVDLVRGLHADLVVLVADPGLGAINSVRLAVAAFDSVAPVVVVLNRFDPADSLHRANQAWLTDRAGLQLVPDAAALAELVRADAPAGPSAS